ncbi:polyamine deacetylase HDAC10 isoform X3 [Hippopotamus amphibius kiboko]|uniref:polyamine deacetylase HDAC10 isoform X3 n=1 Tax=Hippopotamus amphibius kiboko TaxID=575201 RepID=UPI0025989632|nr:polyamine deacetylase HDAC10 isoform X3 [Hippopotamus amphibius kiboko]
MGTALVYHEDMTAARLLWDDPECEIECPERLTMALERLQQRGLEQRCLRLAAREASEAELGLVHSPEYVALLRGTQALGTRELQALSRQYDSVYFHPSTFHCARLAAGAALQLVDAVLAGAVRNGLALVRPPGHHSQRAAANGFCVFNNVAIAARHAQQKHGLHRFVPVWLQESSSLTGTSTTARASSISLRTTLASFISPGTAMSMGASGPTFESQTQMLSGRGGAVASLSTCLGTRASADTPWPQVGMGNADYVAAFLHVLLPLAFEFNPELVLVSAGFDSAIGDPEGQMQATPECFAHLTQLLQVLAGGRVCAVLEGGYHLESLSQSVCMTVQALLGDPAPPLSGPLVPQGSALESIQSVRAAHGPHWTSLQQQGQRGPERRAGCASGTPAVAVPLNHPLGAAPVPSPSTRSPEGRPSALLPGAPEFKAAATQTMAALSSLLDQLHLNPTPPVRTAVALTAPDAVLVLTPDVLCEEGSAPQEEMQAWARLHEALAQDRALTALGKVLYLVDRILDGQVSSGIAATPALAVAATLDVAIRCGLSHGAQRLLCVAVGQLDRPPGLADDGTNLWLNIGGKEAAALSMFHVSVPLPGTTGGFLSCVLALVLPLAYSFQPDLVLVALGPAHGLRDPQAALLAALLRGPAGGRVLALVEEVSWMGWTCCGVGGGEKPATHCFHFCCLRKPHPGLRWSWPGGCTERHPPAWVPSPRPPQRTRRPWCT